MQRDIKERHLLRLGAGEKSLDTDKDFSKWGRVNFALARRMQLLAEVQRLAHSLGIAGDFGFTCETAEYFNLYHVVARWEVFTAALGKVCGASDLCGAVRVRVCQTADVRADCASLSLLQMGKTDANVNVIADTFPFAAFFANAPGGLERLFQRKSYEDDLASANACYDHLKEVFEELAR